jgi:hypothetical protein
MSHLVARPVLALTFCVALGGCAHWGKDAESVQVCERGFANDPDWRRASAFTRGARKAWKTHPAFDFQDRRVTPVKASTIWFRNPVSAELASCSRHTCEGADCFWRVRLFAKTDERWRVRTEYDLGRSRKR